MSLAREYKSLLICGMKLSESDGQAQMLLSYLEDGSSWKCVVRVVRVCSNLICPPCAVMDTELRHLWQLLSADVLGSLFLSPSGEAA